MTDPQLVEILGCLRHLVGDHLAREAYAEIAAELRRDGTWLLHVRAQHRPALTLTGDDTIRTLLSRLLHPPDA